MKYLFFMFLVFTIVNCSSEQSSKSVSTLSSFKDSTSYALGADLGENLKGISFNTVNTQIGEYLMKFNKFKIK